MTAQDTRWIQRFNHFRRAFAQLRDAADLARQRPLSNLERQGLIQAFEYTHELAWNTLKDFLTDRGISNLYGSKDATRAAFKAGLIEQGDIWMDMIRSRNLTSHTYNEDVALEVISAILNSYFNAFAEFESRMEQLKREQP